MDEEKKKKWWNSSYRWKYLKIAMIYFTTPGYVYTLAHKSRSVNLRERVIRGRLVKEGVLSNDRKSSKSDIDLDLGHI